MSRDDIIRMARDAGLLAGCDLQDERAQLMLAGLSQFATAVATAEREACAKLCEAIEADRWGAYKGHVPHEQRPENGCEYVHGRHPRQGCSMSQPTPLPIPCADA